MNSSFSSSETTVQPRPLGRTTGASISNEGPVPVVPDPWHVPAWGGICSPAAGALSPAAALLAGPSAAGSLPAPYDPSRGSARSPAAADPSGAEQFPALDPSRGSVRIPAAAPLTSPSAGAAARPLLGTDPSWAPPSCTSAPVAGGVPPPGRDPNNSAAADGGSAGNPSAAGGLEEPSLESPEIVHWGSTAEESCRIQIVVQLCSLTFFLYCRSGDQGLRHVSECFPIPACLG